MQVWAGVTLIIGSILFMIAAFMPISMRVFDPSLSARDQIAIVEEDRGQWLFSSALFGAGGLIAAAGLLLFARHVQGLGLETFTGNLAVTAAIVAAIGAVFWTIVSYLRFTRTPEEIFIEGAISGGWLFPAYTVMTQLALIAIGYVLIQSGYPAWLGWGMIVLVSLTIVGLILFRDMPPFVHYVWTLVMGITILLSNASQVVTAASGAAQ